MKFRAIAPLVLCMSISLTACGEGDDGESTVATDSSTPTLVPVDPPVTPEPTTPDVPKNPEPGTLPDFAPQNYTFVYDVMCYCPGIGPVKVTVVDGEVTDARYVDSAMEEALPEFRNLTIQDIIDEANKPSHDELEVKWPSGQAYPDSIFIDRIKNAMDDETTYTIKEVTVAD